jgi:hypothetical protein
MMLFAAAVIITLHSGTGVPIEINPHEITSMRNPEPTAPSPSFSKELHCMINMSDGKYVTVKETCDQVKKMIEGHDK